MGGEVAMEDVEVDVDDVDVDLLLENDEHDYAHLPPSSHSQ